MKAILAVILDVDGTVATCPYDFDGMRAAVTRVAAKWGVDAASLAGQGIIERIALIAERLGERGGGFRKEAEQAVCALEVAAAETAHLLPGAAAALARLRQHGLKIGLITRNCRAAAARVLSGLRDYDVLLTREDVPDAKPHPDHVLRAAAALGCRPDQAAVVGDHAFDMQAGRAAGACICIGVRTGNSPDASLSEMGADVILDSLADLPDWLLGDQEAGWPEGTRLRRGFGGQA
jgi:phosphoglycolate phosphatase